jgi:hypothetical protein
VQRHPVEDLHLGTVLDDQALDEIEAVQLGVPGGDAGQVPARRRTARSLAMVTALP